LQAHLRNGQFRVLILGGSIERNMPADDRPNVRVSPTTKSSLGHETASTGSSRI
jgi:hypothetical protein